MIFSSVKITLISSSIKYFSKKCRFSFSAGVDETEKAKKRLKSEMIKIKICLLSLFFIIPFTLLVYYRSVILLSAEEAFFFRGRGFLCPVSSSCLTSKGLFSSEARGKVY